MLRKNNITDHFPIAGLITILAILVYLYSPVMLHLIKDWSIAEYSHGFLLPFLAMLMVWHSLAGWKKEDICPSWYGFFCLVAGLLLFLVGELSTFRQLSYFSIVVTLLGLALSYFGTKTVKRTLPAFVLLLFAVPLPFMVYNNLSLVLKLISTSFGVFLIELAGFSVYQDGNVIDLGIYKLQVVDACNGLRYLFPGASFGYLVAYLLHDVWWKRALIFLSSIPITIVMNSLRIALIGITVNIWGIEAAEGLLHTLEGFVVFAICVTLMLLEAFILLKTGKTGGYFDWDFFSIPDKKIMVRPVINGKLNYATVFTCIIFLLINGMTMSQKQPTEPSAPVSLYMPHNINGWEGEPEVLSDYLLNELKLTDYVLTNYRDKENASQVNLYIAYYADQKIGSTIHSPATCLPGGGWQTLNSNTTTVSVNRKGVEFPLPITKMIVTKGDQKIIIYYWYYERGRLLTSQLSAKWYLFTDSLMKKRSDGALIRLSTTVSALETEDIAEKRLQKFLGSSCFTIEKSLSDVSLVKQDEPR